MIVVKCILIALSLSLTALPTFAAESNGGNHGGGGGDTSTAAEFELIANAIGERAGETYREDELTIFGTTPQKLAAILKKMHVTVSLKPLYLGARAVEAINYPATGLVQVYKAAWMGKRDTDGKVLLVIHEILGLLGIKDPLYKKSAEVLQKLKRNVYVDKIDGFNRILNFQARSLIKKVVCSVHSKAQNTAINYTLGHREGWEEEFHLSETLEEKYWLQVSIASSGTRIELFRRLDTSGLSVIAKSDTSSQGGELMHLDLDTEYFYVSCSINPTKKSVSSEGL